MISSLNNKLNRSWKIQRIWNVPLVLLERSWWAWFNIIYLVRFGFRMWKILIFKWCLPLNIQINSQKTRFWKENSVEDMVTLGPTALVIYNWLQISTHNHEKWDKSDSKQFLKVWI
jgi:hypothetical protein